MTGSARVVPPLRRVRDILANTGTCGWTACWPNTHASVRLLGLGPDSALCTAVLREFPPCNCCERVWNRPLRRHRHL